MASGYAPTKRARHDPSPSQEEEGQEADDPESEEMDEGNDPEVGKVYDSEVDKADDPKMGKGHKADNIEMDDDEYVRRRHNMGLDAGGAMNCQRPPSPEDQLSDLTELSDLEDKSEDKVQVRRAKYDYCIMPDEDLSGPASGRYEPPDYGDNFYHWQSKHH